jgi:methylenetetrahydrofolate reductase (NADPH)
MSDSSQATEIAQITSLMKGASVEMTCKDVQDLPAAAALLPAGTDIFIALFPNQTFDELTEAAKAVKAAGLNPVPHVPARRIKDVAEVTKIAQGFAAAGVSKFLLIAGDMPAPEGAFDSTIGVLESGEFAKAGIKQMYMAGHPEGHAHMTTPQLREYEARKVAATKQQGVELSFVTQVVFEPEPMIEWENTLRATGISNLARPGLPGPAGLKTLLRYAKICGAGASIRALTGGKMGLVANLLGDSGPEDSIRALAAAQAAGKTKFGGLHFFAFGGFLKTSKFVAAIQKGQITLDAKGEGFSVST